MTFSNHEEPLMLKIVGYNTATLNHVCEDVTGRRSQVDVQVDGGLGDAEPESLIGKTVRAEYLLAYVYIASGVTLVKGDK